MNERKIAEKNKILELVSGSFLYGTNTETSDKDYYGVFMPDIEYVLGFRKCEEVDFSVISKDEDDKNTIDAVDRKFYEFRKFMKLSMENNPNIIEILFVNSKNTLFVNDIGKELLKIKHKFPHKGAKQKFLGYAFSQKHKMVIKKDHYFDLISALDYIQRFDDGKTILEVVLESNFPKFFSRNYDSQHNVNFIEIGDLNITASHSIRTVKAMLQDRIDKVGNREELLLKYGFDTKFASHLIRLMLEGIELLETGEIKFPLRERQLILDVKLGKWTINKILDFSNDLEKKIEELGNISTLPDKPNVEELEKFTINTLEKYLFPASFYEYDKEHPLKK